MKSHDAGWLACHRTCRDPEQQDERRNHLQSHKTLPWRTRVAAVRHVRNLSHRHIPLPANTGYELQASSTRRRGRHSYSCASGGRETLVSFIALFGAGSWSLPLHTETKSERREKMEQGSQKQKKDRLWSRVPIDTWGPYKLDGMKLPRYPLISWLSSYGRVGAVRHVFALGRRERAGRSTGATSRCTPCRCGRASCGTRRRRRCRGRCRARRGAGTRCR